MYHADRFSLRHLNVVFPSLLFRPPPTFAFACACSYQVGFSGDVGALTWANMAYQPYFSATAANVLFPFWRCVVEISVKRQMNVFFYESIREIFLCALFLLTPSFIYPDSPPCCSHDIEGPADDLELYVRWIQVRSSYGLMPLTSIKPADVVTSTTPINGLPPLVFAGGRLQRRHALS